MNKCIYAVCAGCFLAPLAPLMALDDQAVVILKKSALNMEQLHSVQLSVAINSTDRPKDGQEKTFEDSMIFTFENGKQRSEVQLTDRTTSERLHIISIFDGSRHQLFYEKSGKLTLSNSPTAPNISLLFNPLELPYLFLSNKTPVSIAELRNATTWDGMHKYCAYEGSEVVNGLRCEKVRVPVLASPNHEATCLVFFVPELNYYPIKSVLTTKDGHVIGQIDVRSHKLERCEGAELLIPTNILFVEKSEERSVNRQTELLVKTNSIVVNTDFDDDQFTIPASRASWVYDLDAKTELKTGGRMASVSVVSQGPWRPILVFSLIAIFLAAAVAWKRWRK